MSEPIMECTSCFKPLDLCICASIKPIKTKTHVLILQHPQEPDKFLGSAQIAHLSLPNSTLKVGLSWANLKKAVGQDVQANRWAVLHLGSGIKDAAPGTKTKSGKKGLLTLVTKAGTPLPDADKVLSELQGLVILDGTWSQAKTLWWRNAWLLKLRRAILVPQQKSLYKELRKEPRSECLSTIESIALGLSTLEGNTQATEQLNATFNELLGKYRARTQDKKKS